MDAASERSPILMQHALNIHVKDNLLLKFVICCVFLCIYRQLDAIIISALISLNKLTWKQGSKLKKMSGRKFATSYKNLVATLKMLVAKLSEAI